MSSINTIDIPDSVIREGEINLIECQQLYDLFVVAERNLQEVGTNDEGVTHTFSGKQGEIQVAISGDIMRVLHYKLPEAA